MSMLLESPIILQGDLSLEDVVTADNILKKEKRRPSLPFHYGIAATMLLFFGMAYRSFDEGENDWIVVASVAGAMLIFFAPTFLNRYQLRQQWKQKVGVFHRVDTTITKDGLIIREPHAEINVGWDHFVAALTAPTVVFLFPSEGWILFGRSRFADDYDWNRFKAFVDDRYPIKPRLV